MPTPTKGARLGGSPAHQRHMLANLATALFEHKAITTTEVRAKRVQPLAEKLISKAKRGDLHSRRVVLKTLTNKAVVAELFEEIAPKVADREGGYTRITKLPNRKGDNAPMALIELVLEPVAPKKKAAPKKAAAPKAEPVVDEAPAEEIVEDAAVEADAVDEAADEVAEDAAEAPEAAEEDAADDK